MHGSAIQLPTGITPFGNCIHFLYKHQIIPIQPTSPIVKQPINKINSINTSQNKTPPQIVNNYNEIINKYSSCPTTLVNFVMQPNRTFHDPFSDFFVESSVERQIDNMIKSDNFELEEYSNYDKIKIKEVEDSIVYEDNSYYVELSWDEEKIRSVPSNHQAALKILDKIIPELSSKNKLKDYSDVFKQQEREGIIEQIQVSPENLKNYKWIPHRPIYREENQVTTKTRAVFNCSLKTGNGYSLNEAAYPGVNLLADMIELMLLFRTDDFVFLADIRKAFLMIKLKLLRDKNRFCFFWKEGDKLICYRYKTLIFGFIASPFILNYVIKHHVSKYVNDECTQMLKNCFYVDNLNKTSNNKEKLIHLYKEAVRRMSEGNFDLRSCNTNCNELKELMIKDKKYVEHGCDLEKVLGYKYNTKQDTIQISNSKINCNVNTKRGVLAQISKVFDPLSLSPCVIKWQIINETFFGK